MSIRSFPGMQERPRAPALKAYRQLPQLRAALAVQPSQQHRNGADGKRRITSQFGSVSSWKFNNEGDIPRAALIRRNDTFWASAASIVD